MVRQRVAKLESFSIEVLDSYLSGHDWEASLKRFLDAHAHEFLHFDAGGSDVAQSHLWYKVYVDFNSTIESLMEREVARMGMAYDDFAPIFQRAFDAAFGETGELPAGESGGAIHSLVRRLSQYGDFESFGMMMQKEAQRMAAEAEADAEDLRIEASDKFLRVLWDVENVPYPRGVQPQDVTEAVLQMLSRHGLTGPGVDDLVTVFYSPQKRTVAPRQAEAMDKAEFEQVFCGTKREDADRKLVRRLHQDMRVLPRDGDRTTFVLISSDQDFRTEIRRATQSGFKVYVVHTAPENSNHLRTLERFASGVLGWREEVLARLEPAMPPRGRQHADDDATDAAVADAADLDGTAGGREQHRRGRSEAQSQRGRRARGRRRRNGGDPPNRPHRGQVDGEALELPTEQRFTGRCTRWRVSKKKNYGFLESPQHPRVFVHNTAIQNVRGFRLLHKGEIVEYEVAQNDKGFLAPRVWVLHGHDQDREYPEEEPGWNS